MLGCIAALNLALAPASTQQREAEKGSSLVTTSWLAGAVALQSWREASKHLGHQGTMVSLPAGVRGPGEVTLTFLCSPVMGVNLPRKLSSPWGSRQKPEEDIGGTMPCPACHVPLWVLAAGCRAARLPSSL